MKKLPNGTTKCPSCGSALHYRNHAGLLVVENGSLSARCPAKGCGKTYAVTPRGN